MIHQVKKTWRVCIGLLIILGQCQTEMYLSSFILYTCAALAIDIHTVYINVIIIIVKTRSIIFFLVCVIMCTEKGTIVLYIDSVLTECVLNNGGRLLGG